MSTFTVPTTAVYHDTDTGAGTRYKAGEIVPIEEAVRLAMPGAALPNAGPPFTDAQVSYIGGQIESTEPDDLAALTIHNYFPDGAVSSDALIDTEASYDADKLWQQYSGSETLSFVAAASVPSLLSRFNAVKVQCPGSGFGEGVYVGDWANTFDGWVDPGRYRVGVTVLSGIVPLMVALDGRNDGGGTDDWSGGVVLVPSGTRRRVVLDIAPSVACTITVAISTTQDYPVNGDLPAAQANTFYVGQLMVTEGDPLVFRDGGSDGWSWSGTAHASPSSGPQP